MGFPGPLGPLGEKGKRVSHDLGVEGEGEGLQERRGVCGCVRQQVGP